MQMFICKSICFLKTYWQKNMPKNFFRNTKYLISYQKKKDTNQINMTKQAYLMINTYFDQFLFMIELALSNDFSGPILVPGYPVFLFDVKSRYRSNSSYFIVIKKKHCDFNLINLFYNTQLLFVLYFKCASQSITRHKRT